MEGQRGLLGEHSSALVIMDHFKGQIPSGINSFLESNDIHVCLLPPNTTDVLQPMDISVNKPAKDFLKYQSDKWYSDKVMTLLHGRDLVELQPINYQLKLASTEGAWC